ncbi:MAG TPA: gas vesicle protein [Micromonosporaceae bacterium]|jgi:hypothetical protein
MTTASNSAGSVAPTNSASASHREPASLADILERVLDKGIVITGDIRINLLDIELLTIKLRLLIVSVETARELGIDWWEHDPWLRSSDRDLEQENELLRRRLSALETGDQRAWNSIDAESEVVNEDRADARR